MPDPADTSRIHTFCGLCIARCGAVAVVENGRFVRLEPDPSHPTGQALCAKGRAAPEIVYSPERLTYPLRRTRPKGDPDPGWERISWDEALDLTATALRQAADRYGPQAVALTVSSSSTTAIGDSTGYIQRFANAFGTPNSAITLDVCGWGRAFATRYTFGVGSVGTGGSGGAMPDIANSGLVILWGYNPSYTRLTHATAVVEAVKRGTKLIVVDPRRVGLASKADLWLRVRPGSDGALALGIANVMIERGWYDRDFIREWSNGPLLVRADTGRLLTEADVAPGGDARRLFAWDATAGRLMAYDCAAGYDGDSNNAALEGEYRIETRDGQTVCHPAFELYARLCRRYPPAAVQEICWIPRAQVEEAARLIWRSRPVSYYAWSGHEQHANVTQTARAMSLLYALTGSFDQRGGNILMPAAPAGSITGQELPAAKNMAPRLGIAERPLGPARFGFYSTEELYRAIREGMPYPVRALVGFGANMLLAHAGGAAGREALKQLDFYAHLDLFMNPTAAMADVVLPVASAFEREGLKIGFDISPEAQSCIQLRPPVVPPPGEAWPDTEVIFALAQRLGLGAEFWEGDIDASYRQQLAPIGIGPEKLRSSPGGVRLPLETRYAKHAEPGPDGAPKGFATPSRKVELYSQTFLDQGYPPLPDFEEPQIGPARNDLAPRFPLVLTSAKATLFCQTQHRQLPSLRKRGRYPEVELHPAAAQERGIKSGDWVSIETPDGSVRARARYNANLDPRVVVGEHGWWQGCDELGEPDCDPFGPHSTNFNRLIGTGARDPVSGTASHRAYLCEIRPAT